MPNTGDSKPPAPQLCGNIQKPGPETLAEAGRLIRAGRLVAFPTETVYGLGADATNSEAVAGIFAAKGRPRFNPLIVHVPDLESAQKLGQFPPLALRLAASFWPGPLTIVVQRQPQSGISDLVSAGLPTLAIRVTNNPVAQALLRATKRPLAAPSANRSGHVSATRAEHVAADLGDSVAMILDGGPATHGLESTIVDASGDAIVLLRPGAVPIEALASVTGTEILRFSGHTSRPTASGQLESHYAPRAAIRLNATRVEPGEALLAFGATPLATSGPAINLSPRGDVVEAAINLFSALRTLDATGARAIAVMPIPADGLGEAINDRLTRAAAPRA